MTIARPRNPPIATRFESWIGSVTASVMKSGLSPDAPIAVVEHGPMAEASGVALTAPGPGDHERDRDYPGDPVDDEREGDRKGAHDSGSLGFVDAFLGCGCESGEDQDAIHKPDP